MYLTTCLSLNLVEKCCGHFQETYGAQHGKGSQQCGTYMYSEIIAAGEWICIISLPKLTSTKFPGVDYLFDQTTQTAIGYLSKDSSDGWTKAGTWVTFNDKNSITALGKYISMWCIKPMLDFYVFHLFCFVQVTIILLEHLCLTHLRTRLITRLGVLLWMHSTSHSSLRATTSKMAVAMYAQRLLVKTAKDVTILLTLATNCVKSRDTLFQCYHYDLYSVLCLDDKYIY